MIEVECEGVVVDVGVVEADDTEVFDSLEMDILWRRRRMDWVAKWNDLERIQQLGGLNSL